MNYRLIPKETQYICLKIFDFEFTFASTLLLDLTCILWLGSMPMRVFLAKILSIFGASGLNQLIGGIIIYLPLLLYIILTKRIPCRYFPWILIICSAFFGITLCIHPDYSKWYFRDIYGIMYAVFRPDHGAIWAFLMVEISENAERLWKNLKCFAVMDAIYCLYSLLVAKSIGYWSSYNAAGEMSEKTYSLDFGYDMIFIFLVATICFFFLKKIYYLLIGIIALYLALSYGSRGAFLCVIVFIALFLLNGSQRLWKRVLNSAVVIIIGSLLYQHGIILLQRLAVMIKTTFGISSRTLEQIITGNIMDDSGRDAIYKIVQKAIAEKPFTGYGAYGDRPLIGPYYYWGYSHSIIYEMFVDFGVVIGSIILILLLFLSLRFIFATKNKLILNIFLIVFSMNMRLIVSDTFWGNRFFWIAFAILILYNKKSLRRGRQAIT